MASQLRTVLDRFADQSAPVSLNRMAHELQLDPAVLHDMIDYWVRKGRLREITSGAACTTCGSKAGCPFVVALPRIYELVRDDVEPPPQPPCTCGGGCPH